MKSLLSEGHKLASTKYQLDVINNYSETLSTLPRFEEKLGETGLFPLRPTKIENFQINVGYACNMTCKHCHVDAGPDRTEIMTKETFEACLRAIKDSSINIVDMTGGAPEMNPHFKWFVEEVSSMGKKIIVRSNLTILDTKKFEDLPAFLAAHGVEITCSLPFYNRSRTDRQRGEGTYDRSVKVLKQLNNLGYGDPDSGLVLNLVYNPVGAFLPPDQASIEKEYKRVLLSDHEIRFNQLFTITNLPISRFLNFLMMSGNLDEYMEKLVVSYNPLAAEGVMCRNTISVGWDGKLYDCDFNQMLEIETAVDSPGHIRDWNENLLNNREIIVNQHCYGCTAGAGSSCGGTTA